MTELERLLKQKADLSVQQIDIDRRIIVEIVRQENGMGSQVAAMVDKYGAVVSCGQAAGILNVAPGTISAMVGDGRLVRVAGGVSTVSIGQYLDAGRPSAQKTKRMPAYTRRAAR